jgi:pimeloyl-ACP methyl ester carboxylesterase
VRRRQFIKAGAATIAAPTVGVTAENCTTPEFRGDLNCPTSNFRGTFVLVHGANFGSWCWRDVRDQLRLRGYRVFTPTLTGLGERRHLLSPTIRLRDHIDDVGNLILSEELTNVVLVGHSYGGTVITGVCDLLQDRISQVVFLDANTPKNGEATIPGLTVEQAEKALGQPLLDGYGVPPLPPTRLGIDADDATNIAWLNRRLTPHPIATLSEPLTLRNDGCDNIPRTFILTTQKEQLRPFALERLLELENDPSWNFRELMVGHAAMVSAPCELTELLTELAESS